MESRLTSEENNQKEAMGFMGTNLNPSSETGSRVPKADFSLALEDYFELLIHPSLPTEC